MIYVDSNDPKLRAMVDACYPNDDTGYQMRQLTDCERVIRREHMQDVATICAGLLFGAAVIWLLAR
jgi:sensor c-di-GMP phosphodiesterase-like protein